MAMRVGRPPIFVRCAIVGAMLAASPSVARAAWNWPSADTSAQAPGDLIASVRWGAEPWIATDVTTPQNALAQIDALVAQPSPPPRLLAARSVVLRVLQRFDDARTSLDLAVARDPHVLDDPDVGLTAGYLAARQHQYDVAFARGRAALPRVEASDDERANLAIELARWSMARGPTGLTDAIAVLREATFVSTRSMLRATLALAYSRAGRVDEAREVARGGQLPTPYEAIAEARRGGLLNSEADAALGTALLLTGRGHDAIDPLTRAAASSPAPWRASLNESLAAARRTPARAPEPPGSRTLRREFAPFLE
jgi:hypothetical protein